MLFGLTIFLSAFLLFQVQLIVAKHLLPWFGGAPSVWTTCQLFFQVSLLGGYAYAHQLTGKSTLRRQGKIHLTLLFISLAILAALAVWSGTPLLAPDSLKPNGSEQPALWLLLILGATVGLPFFVLSATGPLLQRWHSHTSDSLHRTYRLYALSNAGSLLGLLTYPFGFERLLDVPTQALTWASLFVVFAIGCAAVAWRSMRTAGAETTDGEAPELPAGPSLAAASTVPEKWRPWLWFLLSFCSSAMFLSTTNQLTIEVASIPFLWVLPLAIYLMTFIACFDHPRWYSPQWYWIGTAAAAIGILPVSLLGSKIPIAYQILGYSVFLALFCMMCHGELVRLRPGSSKITKFYLLIAMGGAAGGAFVSLGAPAFFPDVWEFNVTVLLGWCLFGGIAILDRTSRLHRGDRWQFGLVMVLLCILGVHFLVLWGGFHRNAWVIRFDWMVPAVGGMALALIVCLTLWRTSMANGVIWPKVVILGVLLLTGKTLFERIQKSDIGAMVASRNFYGVIRVHLGRTSQTGPLVRQLLDGNTIHGVQVVEEDQSMVPTAYYSPSSGIALACRHLLREADLPGDISRRNLHFGVLGMGAGTMAAFADTGDRVKFYEFNPTVVEIAMGPLAHFTFIRDGKGEAAVVAGDGRLSLERELSANQPQKFDLLAMDAFSSDTVPVHLLTEEAFVTYSEHLRGDESVLAINITNRHLDLEPVVAACARKLGFHGIRVDSDGDPPVLEKSSWILLARKDEVLNDLTTFHSKSRALHEREVNFTDRYSNLFRVLK